TARLGALVARGRGLLGVARNGRLPGCVEVVRLQRTEGERAMLRCLRRWGGLPAVVVVAVALAACGGGTAAQVTKPAGPPRPAPVGSAQPYVLYTHCGIDEARIGNRYFEAVHPPRHPSAHPPPASRNTTPPSPLTP